MQELSLNILDIAENSVRAGAALVRIVVRAFPTEDMLSVSIEDDGSGMDEETAKGAADPFYTTRTTRKVGLGLPYFKMNAELTGGAFAIESSAGHGTKVTATFGLGHIDRAPLGDMGQTMSLLAGANPEMDFVYELCAGAEPADSADGSGGFVFDTREVKQVLDGVPISEPEVMAYMASHIDENTKELISAYKI
ncbi:MAG: ATP-binding protein [Clostridiales Family XIII bacterium]|jgi:anti-sigma regulatory factor (Ser/Thr protein kinase)|nr:ATP-binding protein [Clostridiales Family XIII bacterium]